jgi:D-beta-D-heptose 7-phosphate kinase/D-beta-D-heptose 1-phosphate adenosyltransferase
MQMVGFFKSQTGQDGMEEMGNGRIIDRAELKDIITCLKNQGRKIVFTNGCFDIIHVGHIRYLKEAKELGDILIVGLNSDASVSEIKPGRPFNPEGQRAEVLASLYMVDYVTLFDEDTPYELIKELRPDILVKGADWKPEEIVGNDIVKDVQTIPLVQGISTSEIIKRIKEG